MSKKYAVYAPDGTKCGSHYSQKENAQEFCDFKNASAGDYIYSVEELRSPKEWFEQMKKDCAGGEGS